MTLTTDAVTEYRCSFCDKSKDHVTKLIAGPFAYICNGCVDLCEIILESERAAGKRDGKPVSSPWELKSDEEILQVLETAGRRHKEIDRDLAGWVAELRRRGVTWARVGASLGVSRQTAWERFSTDE